jgi:Tol biopolymer transport system component/DNA-binding winged helix-turn-helix (wHTH) protein
MQVLLTLASEPSEVFSRETVQRQVWPDVIVGEDVLIRAIGKIRRAFHDDSVIETVPKAGYRLVAPVVREPAETAVPYATDHAVLEPADPFPTPSVDAVTDAGSSVSLAQAPSRPVESAAMPVWKRFAISVTILILITIAALVVFWRLPRSHSPQAASYITRPFTTDLGSQIQASFSPDSKSVAYVWRKEGKGYGRIYIRSLNSEESRPLSPDKPVTQLNPAWSPDGRQIAFVEKDGTHSSVVIAPSSGGSGEEIYSLPVNSAREYGGLAWSSDGTSLIFPQQNTLEGPSYLIELSLRDRTVRSITSPPPLWDGDFFPAVSPDGSKLAFVRGSEMLARDIYLMDLPNGPVRRITSGCLAMSVAWTEDSSSIVFSSSRNGALSLWRVKAAGGEPQRLAEVGDDAYAPAIARRGNRLMYSHGSAMWGIFSIPLDEKSASPAVILTSSEQDAAPHISPFGDRIVFQSWRSGSRELWTAQMDGSNPVQLTNHPGQSAGNPSWSPDGKLVAFDARLNAFAHVYVIGTGGGKPRAITSGWYNDVAPNWSADGKFLYFGSNRSGTWQIWKEPLDGSRAPQQVTANGGVVAMESSDGQSIYYTRFMMSGLWQRPVTGGREKKLFDGPPADYPEYWTLSRDRLYVLSTEDGKFVLCRVDPATGQSHIMDTMKYSPTVGLSISPNGKTLVYSGLISASSHLTLVEESH